MTARDPYFARLQQALIKAEVAGPTLVVDKTRLDANLDRLKSRLPPALGCRIVAKSLPSPLLLEHVMARVGTDRLMTFNLPMLLDLQERFPHADQLLGKPLTAAALRRFLAESPHPERVQWLVDAPERLASVEAVAEAAGASLRVALEIDVGLRRGGFEPGAALVEALKRLQGSKRLRFSGFMGYEPHLAALPTAFGWRGRAHRDAWARYSAALRAASEVFGPDAMERVMRNAGGSPTFHLYQDASLANEIAIGSALLKPSDFDLESVADFEPACFIAAPVLKIGPARLPGFDRIAPLLHMMSPRRRRALFVHGGKWMAHPVDPPGLRFNRVFGRSSNQEMLNAPQDFALLPDEFVFLRPHQSEAVLLQFGALAVVDGQEGVAFWPVLPATA